MHSHQISKQANKHPRNQPLHQSNNPRWLDDEIDHGQNTSSDDDGEGSIMEILREMHDDDDDDDRSVASPTTIPLHHMMRTGDADGMLMKKSIFEHGSDILPNSNEIPVQTKPSQSACTQDWMEIRVKEDELSFSSEQFDISMDECNVMTASCAVIEKSVSRAVLGLDVPGNDTHPQVVSGGILRVESDESRQGNRAGHPRPSSNSYTIREKLFIVSAAVLLLLLLGGCVGTVLGLTLGRRNQSNNNEPVVRDPPTNDNVYDEEGELHLRQIRLRLLGRTVLFLDADDPQMLATEWLSFVDSPRLSVRSTRLSQRYALMVIFHNNAWRIDRWMRQGWATSGLHECDWSFVECNEEGFVRVLSLDGRDLDMIGSLPAEIGLLKSLESFGAITQRLEGSLPLAIFSLSNLVVLSVPENMLISTIPSDIKFLSNLEYLNLYDNALSGTLPDEMAQLSNLHSVYLGWNSFSGSFWPTLLRLPKIEVFSASQNTNVGGTIPTEIATVTTLKILDAAFMNLGGGIPTEIVQLANLVLLSVRGSSLTGSFPFDEVSSSMTNLVILDVALNDFEGLVTIPTTIGEMSSLASLFAADANVGGTIPSQIGLVTTLEIVLINSNKLVGMIPETMGNCVELRAFKVSNNNLSGTIPAAICSLPRLVSLEFDEDVACDCCGA